MAISRNNRYLRTTKPNVQSLHYLWAVPPSSTQIHNHYNVVLPARAFLGNINAALTSGYQVSSLPSGFSTTTNTPSGAASRVADWQEYFGYYKGYNTFYNDNYWGFLILQNWGNSGTWSTGYSLMHHPSDAIGGFLNTPFTAAGRQFWSAWTLEFASGLKRELDTRSGIYYETLAYPELVDIDYEDGIDSILTGSGVGWWISVTGDPRFNTETIGRVTISGQFVDRTMSGLYSDYLARGGSPPNLTQSVFHASNSGFMSFFTYLGNLSRDYAMTKALYEPLKQFFPRMNCGNYQQTAQIGGNVVYDGFNLASAFSMSTGNVKVSDMDHQAPNLYGPQLTGGRWDDNAGFGTGNSQIWRTFNTRLLDACVSGNRLPVIPWTQPSGQYIANSNTFTPSQSDLEFVWNYGASRGINHWKWFYGAGVNTENYTKMLEHVRYISSRVRYYNNIKNTVYQDGSGIISNPGGGGGLPEV